MGADHLIAWINRKLRTSPSARPVGRPKPGASRKFATTAGPDPTTEVVVTRFEREPSRRPTIGARDQAGRLAVREVAKKVARKSARIAHRLPSDEPASCSPMTKSLQIRTILRVVERAERIRTSDL